MTPLQKLLVSDGAFVTLTYELESLISHNAYHFGRMVFLRQLLGLWPPLSGDDTW